MRVKIILRLSALMLLASCASLSEDECRTGDWQGIGYRDGTQGAATDRFQAHVKACTGVGVQPVLDEWLEGRNAGLPVYCSTANAYRLGRNGGHLKAVCPAADADALRKAYRTGERYYQLTREIRALQHELSDVLDALVGADDATAAILKNHVARINSEIFLLRTRRNLYDLRY